MGLRLFPKGRRFPTYEEGDWKFVLKIIKPGMVCIDVGANQGFYTILLSRQVGSQGRVYAFEPVSSEFRKLQQNLSLNHCPNVVSEKVAIGAAEGTARMIVCLDGHGSRSSLCSPPADVKARTKVERVPLTTLDSYSRSQGIPRIDFIKIDVEGGERDVLRGGEEVLDHLRPVVMIEMADIATSQFGYPSVANYEILKNHGFAMFEVTRIGLLRPAPRKETFCENLAAIPSEKKHLFSDLIEAT